MPLEDAKPGDKIMVVGFGQGCDVLLFEATENLAKLLREAHGSLTISGGIAGFPWDGRAPDELIEIADARALESKRQGKNALTFGPGAEEEAADEEQA